MNRIEMENRIEDLERTRHELLKAMHQIVALANGMGKTSNPPAYVLGQMKGVAEMATWTVA